MEGFDLIELTLTNSGGREMWPSVVGIPVHRNVISICKDLGRLSVNATPNTI